MLGRAVNGAAGTEPRRRGRSRLAWLALALETIAFAGIAIFGYFAIVRDAGEAPPMARAGIVAYILLTPAVWLLDWLDRRRSGRDT